MGSIITNWLFRSKTITWNSDANSTQGFVVSPGSTDIGWNKHGSTLGIWGSYGAASVAVWVPADVDAMNDLLAILKTFDGCKNTATLRTGDSFNRALSKFYGQENYTEYSFDTAKQMVEAYYGAAKEDTYGSLIPEPNTYYVYIKCKDTSRWPYLYNSLQYTDDITIQANTDAEKTHGFIWAITTDGTNITKIVNAEIGKGIKPSSNNCSTTLTSFTLTPSANSGYYYLINTDGISSDHDRLNCAATADYYYNEAKIRAVTTWAGNHTDNEWTFEPVDMTDMQVYNVVINNDPGNSRVTYDGTTVANHGFFISSTAPTASTVTATDVEGYTYVVVVKNNTVTVTYTQAKEANKFYKFKHSGFYNSSNSRNRYWNGGAAPQETPDASCYFFFDGSHLLQYSTGYYANGTTVANQVVETPITYTFPDGKVFGTHSNGNAADVAPDGTYGIHGSNMNGSLAFWESSGARDLQADNWSAWYIEEVTELPVTIWQGTNANLGTMNLPVAVTLPANVYAYVISGINSNTITLNKAYSAGDVVPANTPVLLYTADEIETGGSKSYNMTITTGGTAPATNLFSGTTAKAAAPTGINYVLAADAESNNVFKSTSATNINGFKAYIHTDSASPIKAFNINLSEDIEDAVISISEDTNSNVIYNVAGQRIEKAQKGINIINGKKILK